MRGIDVSKWQGGLDTRKIADIDFVIAKASGGTGYVDPYCASFYYQAKESGRLFGFYHFACDGYGDNSGTAEAQFFYRCTKGLIGLGLPILDLEDSGISNWGVYTRDFLAEYERLSGVRPIVYTGLQGINSLADIGLLESTPIWFAGYPLGYINYWLPESASPRDHYQINPKANIIMWQFTSAVQYQGYDVDCNIGYIDDVQWHELGAIDMAISDDDARKIAKYTAEEIFNREFSVNGQQARVPFWQLVSWCYFYAKQIFNRK